MTNQEIDDKIAKFLGLPTTKIGTSFVDSKVTTQVPIHWGFYDDISWLMSLVDTIENKGYCFKICRRRVEIDKDGEHGPHPWILVKKEDKKTSILYGILEFIDKYKP